jgi:hypothetical protein
VAAGAANDFTFLAEAARRSINDLREASLARPADAGRRGAHFRDVVTAYLGALERAVKARETDFGAAKDDNDRRSVVREMRLINHAVLGLHTLMPWIESTRRATVGLGLVYVVDEIVSALLKSPADVVITPDPLYMYRTVHKPLERQLRDLSVAYPAATAPVIVAYPAQEPDSLFLHLIVAHEIGHSAITEHDLAGKVWTKDPDPSGTQKLVGDAVSGYMTVESASQASAVGTIGAIIRSWFTECLCDMLALGVLGPSFLVTLAAFGTPFGGPEPSDTHPPFTLRTKLLIDRLDAWGWRPLLEKQIPSTFRWIESIASTAQEAGYRTYFDRVFEVINRNSQTMGGVVDQHIGNARFEPKDFDPVAEELGMLLDRDILPAQLLDRASADRRAILLAGMLRGFRKHGDDPAAVPLIVADRSFQRFLMKGLEMSAVLERWVAP